MPGLFEPYHVRGVTLRNRIVVSPMCQYSSQDGFANDWHLVHLGSRAVGGAGLVMTEAAAVTPVGRITPRDLGIYHDAHVTELSRITRFLHEHGARAGIQLAHAGRKASTAVPWKGGAPLAPGDAEGWTPVAPSALPYDDASTVPHAMSIAEIRGCIADFVASARRAVAAGFDLIELHAAHGYLLHEFYSPCSNSRVDDYGGSFSGRTRLLREVVAAVRAEIPETMPLFVRISAVDWVDGGWTIEDSVTLVRNLERNGVDLVDVSSGGLDPHQRIAIRPHYQVPFAAKIRRDTGVATGAVGLITEATAAEAIIAAGEADLVFLARAMLRDPYWPLHAAAELGEPIAWPQQYARAAPK